MLQALEEAKTRDRLYIPSRYQLFTLNQVRQVGDLPPLARAESSHLQPLLISSTWHEVLAYTEAAALLSA